MIEISWWGRLSGVGRGLAVVACCGSILCIILSIVIAVIVPSRQSCNEVPADHPIGIPGEIPVELANTCQTPGCLHIASKILKNMDSSVDPCDNFYQFACGNFMETTIIPDHRIHVDAFTSLEDELHDDLKRRIEEILDMNQYKPTKLTKTLYKSCMDVESIEKEGLEPLLTILEDLGGWPVLEAENWNETNFQWTESVYKFRDVGLPTNYFIEVKIGVSFVDNTKNIIYIDQPSLALPHERLVGEMNSEILTAYHEYMIDVAVLLGASEDVARKELAESLQFEKDLANISLSSETRLNITKTFVTMTVENLSERYSKIPWKEYINRLLEPKASVKEKEELIILDPEYISNFQILMEITPQKVQANYLMWRAVAELVDFLSENIRNKRLDFESKMYGRSGRESRWQECVRVVSDRLSFAVSSLYVKQFFNQDVRKGATEIFHDLKEELTLAVQEVQWMDDMTKKNALHKILTMSSEIGYSDDLMDGAELEEFYRNWELTDESYLKSILNVTRFKTKYSIDALRKPFVKSDWQNHGDAVEVNTHYTPVLNSIEIPAGILRGHFFNNDRPKYTNYGGIGFLIGHEMFHGFDELGRYFYDEGNAVDWWSSSTEQNYVKRIECITNQYGNYTVSETGSPVNGIRTRRKNLADNGGARIAYQAYKKWASKNKEEMKLPGLDYTSHQMFWISMATAWCSSYRPENLKLILAEDPHSPSEFRIVGSMSNIIDFAKDFKCSEGTKMNPEQKCNIWNTCWERLSPVGRGLMIASCCTVLLCIALAIAVGVIASKPMTCNEYSDEYEQSAKFHGISPIPCDTPACIKLASEIHKNMNKSAEPCDDFYKFACGNFMATTSIPDDKSKMDEFTRIETQLLNQLKISMENTIEPDDHRFIQHVKTLYQSCMDKKTIESQGIEPLAKLLAELGGWPVVEGDDWNEDDFHWIDSVFKFRDMGLPIDILIRFNVDIDLKNNENRKIYIDQPSFGIYYEILVHEMNQDILQSYLKYMVDIAVLLGASEEAAKMELTESLLFEVQLAEISLSKERRRTVTKLYNPMTIDDLSKKHPSIPWKEYFNRLLAPKANVEGDETIIVRVPKYIENFEELIEKTPKRVQANYIIWRAVMTSIEFLSEDIRSKQLEYDKVLSGKPVRGSRWAECVHVVSRWLTLAVGSLYVRKNFDADSKKYTIDMVRALRHELVLVLENVKWMDAYTRRNALRKVAAMTSHIAYPEELKDDKKLDKYYKDVVLTSESYLHNILNLSRFELEHSFGSLRQPFNKTDWKINGDSATINAFYSPILNSIRIPAAILQGNYFNRQRPRYLNYAGIGFIIGHELTHGFDDMGRYFDQDGNIIDWWTPSSERQYRRRVRCIIRQYDNFMISQVGKHLDGKKTRNENIADVGGVKLAYLAYTRWALKHGRERSLPGLYYTPRQLFWISMANSWCSIYRDELLKLMIVEDPHSPAEFRVRGPFSNLWEFARDFNCPIDTGMNPRYKCVVW